jgi:hypothetical protein
MNKQSGKNGLSTLRWEEVLILSQERKSQATIRRCYDIWRREMQIPVRCDNSLCNFHSAPLVWNGKLLKLILDHSDGNRFNNVPNNLQYLCPNCDSQLLTSGGANRGRVESVSNDGYILKNRDGSKIAASTARARGNSTVIGVGSVKKNEEA